MVVCITKLSIEDWSEYKALRLKALKEDPLAFSDSFEEALEKIDDHWLNHLKSDKTSSVSLFAKSNEKLIGMVALIFSHKNKTAHTVELVGNYVDKDYRGQGVGSMMMEAIINEAKSNPKIKKIILDVVATQLPGIKLYEKYGFKKVGKRKDQFFHDGKYYDLIQMEKFL